MLQTDRLRLASSRALELLEKIPAEQLAEQLPADVPRVVRPFAPLIVNWLRNMAIDSLRHLPDRAAQSPAADAWLQHGIALVAWLDGQTDVMPPLLEQLDRLPGSAPATE